MSGPGVAHPRWPGLLTAMEGRLVSLVPLAREHETELFEAARHEEIWRWFGRGDHLGASPETFGRWIDHCLRATAAGEEAVFTVLDPASGRPLGSASYMELRPEDRGLEIGSVWLTPSAWGSGAFADMSLLMLQHAFERLGVMRVEYKTDARNQRTRSALAALPAHFEGIFRKHRVMAHLPVRDSAWYSVVDDEWPAVRAQLEGRVARAAERRAVRA